MNDTVHEPGVDLAHDATAELETRVRIRLRGRVAQFRLELRGPGFVLRGQAQTYYAKQLAQHAVMAATELPIVANEIEVR
jgi:hypothetical protein